MYAQLKRFVLTAVTLGALCASPVLAQTFGFDAEVHKQFRMPYKESHALQFRFEAFNALNHPNWAMPNLNILAKGQNFGVVTSTSTAMRQIQLGLKYLY